jgi:hypothetical protein
VFKTAGVQFSICSNWFTCGELWCLVPWTFTIVIMGTQQKLHELYIVISLETILPKHSELQKNAYKTKCLQNARTIFYKYFFHTKPSYHGILSARICTQIVWAFCMHFVLYAFFCNSECLGRIVSSDITMYSSCSFCWSTHYHNRKSSRIKTSQLATSKSIWTNWNWTPAVLNSSV